MANGSAAERAAPEFRIRAGGRDLAPETLTDVTTVAVHDDVDAPGMFTSDLVNWDQSQLRMKWSDSDDFKVSTEIEVLIGYRDTLKKVISGEITGLELKIHGRETPILRVRGYDRRHRLMRGKKTATFRRMKDSDIASQIASGAGLSPEAEDTRVNHEYVIQHNQTDLEFLLERARRINYEVKAEDRELLFRRRKNSESEAITLDREMDLIEFYPRLTTVSQVGEIGLRGWDPKNKSGITARAAAGQENARMGSTTGPSATNRAFGSTAAVAVDRPVSSQAEADQFASARLSEMALSYITGDGVCIGNTSMKAGSVVKIVGMGKRFSGLYYVTSVIHNYLPSRGYRTAFTFRRNAE